MRVALSILCASLLLASLACGRYGKPERVVPSDQQAIPALAKQATPDADDDAGKDASKSPKP